MITIKDIAAMANVSRSTVSRALNNSGYVGEESRKRIEKVIEETGYVPSEHAKSLRTKKTKVIGVILPTIQTETSSKTVTGIDEVLSKQGYQILLANTNLDKEKEIEFLDLLKNRQVDGMILLATNTAPSLIEKIKELHIPIVVVGQEIEGVSNILYDDYHAAREITSLLISKGHKHIGFIGVDETDRAVGYLRKKGFTEEMMANNLRIEKGWIQKGIFDVDSGYDAMEMMMSKSETVPSATFAVTDRLAIGAMSYLKKARIKVPRDMAIASIGASEFAQYVDPPLTTIDYQNEQAGQVAAEVLLEKLTSNQSINNKIVQNYRLLLRDSV